MRFQGKHRRRARSDTKKEPPKNIFYANPTWYEPENRKEVNIISKPAGKYYMHLVTVREVADRLEQVPARFLQALEVVELSPMTKNRSKFPCYAMQWGQNIYLYPIEENLIETYVAPPRPEQQIEARRFGGKWSQEGKLWKLRWTPKTIKDFYLENILMHELGHINDDDNNNPNKREAFANSFAIKYGWKSRR